MTGGAWAGFKYFTFTGGESRLSVKVRGSGGMIKVFTDRRGKAVCEMTFNPSEEFQSITGKFSVPAGVHPLYFVYEGSGAIDFTGFTIQ